jgi:hypothetical protein
MPPQLSLVHGEARVASLFRPPPYRLGERAQRPGELADLLVADLGTRALKHADVVARAAGLPLPLAVVIAIESERALGEAATAADLDRADLVEALDAASADRAAAAFDAPPTRRLRAYGTALRSGGYRRTRHDGDRLELAVPHRLLACWTVAAQEARQTLNDWLSEMITAATTGRESWEAAAAAEGRTLAEWIALQALKRARRSSSSAQATAPA